MLQNEVTLQNLSIAFISHSLFDELLTCIKFTREPNVRNSLFSVVSTSATRSDDFWKSLGDIFSLKISQKWWLLFGLKWEASFFSKNYRGSFLGDFWTNLGYFLLQHLVTLVLSFEREAKWGQKHFASFDIFSARFRPIRASGKE